MTITEDEFIARFQPEKDEHGCYYRQRDWTVPEDLEAINVARAEGRVWTQVDGDDGQWVLSSGYHIVNRNFYVICAVPVPAGESFEVVDDDIGDTDLDTDLEPDGAEFDPDILEGDMEDDDQ